MKFTDTKKEKKLKALLDFIEKGKEEGKTLSELFAGYAKKTGRAKGSVRNLYYELLRQGEKNADFRTRVLGDFPLKAEPRIGFSEAEERALLLEIFRAKKKGVSMRKAIQSVSAEEKTALRYQNKLRNLLKKNRPLVEKTVAEIRSERGYCYDPYSEGRRQKITAPATVPAGLAERFAAFLRTENARLFEENARLTQENERLASSKVSAAAKNLTKRQGKAARAK